MTAGAFTTLPALGALTTRFEALLVNEEQALRGHDLEAVRALAAEKSKLVAELETCLAGLPAAAAADHDARAALHERLAACQHHNRLNGALIEANRSFNSLLLEVLRGQPAGTRAQVYGRHGGLTEIRGSGTLARA